jgi:hypothetical protein
MDSVYGGRWAVSPLLDRLAYLCDAMIISNILAALFALSGFVMMCVAMVQFTNLQDERTAISTGVGFWLFGLAAVCGLVGMVHG